MTPLVEFLNLITDTADANCNLDTPIVLDELRAEGGIYAELGESFAESTYFSKHEVVNMPVLFLCRHKDQQRCLEQLEAICNYISRLKTYPQGETVNWLDCSVAKKPSKIGRDEDGTYHYSCILRAKIHY